MKFLFKLILILALLTSLPKFMIAQSSTITLRGKVNDSISRVPLGYAVVAVYLNDTLKIRGIQTDETGGFVMAGLKTGLYILKVSFIGYKDYVKKLKANVQDTSVKILLTPGSIHLSDVTVKGNRSLITSFGGGFQFNPKDISVNRTGSAVDLLAQVPGVMVEDNSDVKLKGNVAKVMVNGKLINLSGQELQNFLKSISADRIVNITVNTNPSSKYDAASNAGLIDIQLKNKFDQGFYASVSSKFETLPGTWDAINADYTKNKFTLSLGLTYLYRKDRYIRDNYIINKQGPDSNYYNLQHAILPQKQEVFNPRVEVNYNIDSASFVNASINFPFSSNNFPVMLRSDNQDKLNNPVNYFLQNETVNYKGNFYNYNLNYVKNFKKHGQQFSVGGFYTKTIFDPFDSYTRNYYTVSGIPDTSQNVILQSNSQRIYRSSQLQSDFTLLIGKVKKLSMGIKNSYSLIDSYNPIETYNYKQQKFVKNPQLSNNLNYNENITAGYLIFNHDLKKISYGLGLRYEYSAINVNSTVDKQDYGQRYGNFFPNLTFTYRISDFQSIDFSYARKVDRTPYSFLDPFINTTDPNNYFIGNPYLKPSYINSLELQYSKQWNPSNSAIVTLSYVNKNAVYAYPVTTFSTAYNHIITTYTNANDIKSVSLSVIANNKISEWWQVNSYAGLSASNLKTDSSSNFYYKPKPYFSCSVTNTFSLSKRSVIRLTGFFNSTSYQYQAKLNSMGSVNIGFQRSMLNKKLTLNVDAYDIFKTRKFNYTTNSNYYYERSITTIKSRYLSVALSYAFGKSTNKPTVKKLSNDRIDI